MKKKDYLEECGYISKATTLGEMFVGFDEWEDLSEMANEVGGEIYLLKKQKGERVYQSLGLQYDKYDRVDDFNDKCVDVFFYHDEWAEEDTIKEVFETCIRHRIEDALTKGEDGTDNMLDTLNDFDRIKEYITEYLTSNSYILTVDEYLSCDVIERYPTIWFEDVWEYRMALKLPNMQWVTRDRKHGNIIECFDGKEDAEQAIISYEQEDKEDGVYEDDFYEVAYVEA